jgi:hypothetical protein
VNGGDQVRHWRRRFPAGSPALRSASAKAGRARVACLPDNVWLRPPHTESPTPSPPHLVLTTCFRTHPQAQSSIAIVARYRSPKRTMGGHGDVSFLSFAPSRHRTLDGARSIRGSSVSSIPLRFAPLPTAECQQTTVDGPPAASQTHRQGVPSLLALCSTNSPFTTNDLRSLWTVCRSADDSVRR